MTDKIVITREFLQFIMKDSFPGCRLVIRERMGGCVLMMAMWHYELAISLNQRAVSVTDVVGEVTMTLTYKPQELQADKPSATIPLRQITTVEPDRVKQFVSGVRAYMRGIVQAINTATDDPANKEANIFEDGFEDD